MRGQKATKHAHYPPWDDEKWARAADMWTNGHSAGEIASDLGPNFTRNAVLGKIHRMGFAERSKSPSKIRGAKTVKAKAGEKAKAATPVIQAPPLAPVAKRQGYPERAVVLTPKEIADARQPPAPAVGLLDLRPGQCKWPFGAREFVFCGAPVVGRQVNGLPCPFCETHARLAYAPRLASPRKGAADLKRENEKALKRYMAA